MAAAKVSYNEYERKTLLDLVLQHRTVVDSKRVDSDTLTKKRQIWLKITNEYNRHPKVRKRLTKQLRRLWENTKAKAKKSATGSSSGSSIAHQLLNESTNDEDMMETIHTENNPNVDQSSDCDEVFVVQNGNTARMVNVRPERVQPKKVRQYLDKSMEQNGFNTTTESLLDEDQDQYPDIGDMLAPGMISIAIYPRR